MKILVVSSFLIILSISCYSQDTIFADPYPNGIISDNYTTSTLKFILYPVENPNYRIVFNKGEVEKILLADGTAYNNPKYKKSNMIVLNTVPLTGEIFYRDILTIDSVSKSSLYKIFRGLKTDPSSDLNFRLLSEDPSNNSTLTYEITFSAKYAGDDALVFITMTFYFKDNKVMYILKDFYVTISYKKYGFSFTGGPTHQKADLEKLEKYYPTSRGDTEKFWKPIAYNIKFIEKLLRSKLILAKESNNSIENQSEDIDW